MTAKFNKTFAMLIVIVALVPLIPILLMTLSPLLMTLLILFGIAGFRPLRRLALAIFQGLVKIVSGILSFLARTLFVGFGWLLNMPTKDAQFMSFWDRFRYFRKAHTGFMIDGKGQRLSEKASYESVLVQGGMGRGKTSTFVIPNLLQPPSFLPSFVITDTSGEIFLQTSGFLKKKGYAVRVLNLSDSRRSESYNPLHNATSPQQIAELAKILVKSSSGRQNGQVSNDPFWEQASEKLIRILAQCLSNQPDPRYLNLANLRSLILGFDAHVAPKGQLAQIDHFVLTSTQNDPSTFNAYKAFVQGNIKTIQSVLMSADVALDALATPDIAALTATNSFSFDELRQNPTIIYVIVNQMQMEFYAFLLNLFYTDLFRSLLRNPQNPGRPVWLFLDEFGHLSVPGFEVFSTTARKYKVGFMLFLQSLAQLENRYGSLGARTVQEALATEIYLPGMALDTALNLEARLGRTAKGALMPANDIIRMKENEALVLHSNALPLIIKTKRFFEQGTLNRRSRIAPATLPLGVTQPPTLLSL